MKRNLTRDHLKIFPNGLFQYHNDSSHELPRIGVFPTQGQSCLQHVCCWLFKWPFLFLGPMPWDFNFIGSLEVSDSKAQEQLLYWKENRRILGVPSTGLGARMVSAVCPETPRFCPVPCRNHAKRGFSVWQVLKSCISSMLEFGAKRNSSTQCKCRLAEACGLTPSKGAGFWLYRTSRHTPVHLICVRLH